MKRITVDLGARSYPIIIGEALLGEEGLFDEFIKGQKVCIITNSTIADMYLDKLHSSLKKYKTSVYIIEDGEQYKNLVTYTQILDHLLSQQVDRKSTVIALGGGVVGDVAGFAAASCLRGINFIQVPTTLLAQVDSSVGGKTGVNHRLGKNLIGAFYQPSCVVADLNTLDTLPTREFSSGMAEVIKYGLIRDRDFFEWIEANYLQVREMNKQQLAHIVARSCEIKAEVVSEDETEQGLRAILNLGHTFGHAIEAALGYGQWLHGEAISAGMVMAVRMSAAMGDICDTTVARVCKLFSNFDLPVTPPESISKAQMKTLMAYDKKTVDSLIKLVLLRQLGEAYVSDNYPGQLLDQTIKQTLKQ